MSIGIATVGAHALAVVFMYNLCMSMMLANEGDADERGIER